MCDATQMFFWFKAALGPAECALQHQEFAAAGAMQTLGGRADRELGVLNPSEQLLHFQQPWHKAEHLRAVLTAACWR